MLSPNTQLLACSKQLLRISSANRVTLTSTGTLTQAKTHQCLHRNQDTAQGPQATGQETPPSGTAEPPVHSNKWPVSSNSPAHPPSKKTLLNRCQSPQPLGKMLGQEAQCGDTGFCFLWFLGHRMLSPAFTRKSMSGACWNGLSWPPSLGPQMLATFVREQGQRWTRGPAEKNAR